MKRIALILLGLALIRAQGTPAQRLGYFPKGGPDKGQQVSLIQLIANPQVYDHRLVRVIGYLHLEFEGSAIYFHRDDFENAIPENSVWINLPKDISETQMNEVNNHYVICTARFIADKHGHMGMFAGELDNVERLETWSKPVVRMH